jgi:hypothetical protein
MFQLTNELAKWPADKPFNLHLDPPACSKRRVRPSIRA